MDSMQDRFSQAPVSQLIGFDVLPSVEGDAQKGRAIVKLAIDERFHNPMGRVHGGIISALADAAMGIAFGRTLDAGQDFSTIDLHVHFMRPVQDRPLTATGLMIQRGLRVGFMKCEIVDDRQRIIAHATCSCTVLQE